MSSIKKLKKGIDVLFSYALGDCFFIADTVKPEKKDAIMAIAATLLEKHSEFRVRANHPDGKENPKLVKEYYRELISEMNSFVDEFLTKLAETADQK